MAIEVHCSSCGTLLRVPENLLGKLVKCPKCKTTFTATEGGPAETVEPEEVSPEPAPRSRRPAMPPEEGIEEEPVSRPRRPARAAEDYDDYGDEDYGGRLRVGRGQALSAVGGPATALLVVGIIDIVLGILNIVLRVLGVGLVTMGPGAGGGRAGGAGDQDMMIGLLAGVPIAIITIVFGILITLGAGQMKSLKSYGFAMTACILAMIPCVNCCLLGLPFGIWGITALNRPEVKDAFGRRD